MSGRIPRSFIDDLLVRVDIVDLIDSRVPLKKSGNNFVARCPFHNEKTPSFSVNRSRQIYHCFGCGVSGNAISFLMSFNHLDFIEAVEDLAAFVGVDVPRESGDNPLGNQKLGQVTSYELLERVAQFYVGQFRGDGGKVAIDYLKRRGVSGDVARDYGLGYSPDNWDALLSRFDRKGLIDTGMLVVRDDGKVYDRFRGRLMFPIRDKRGRVLGFGGRVLDDSLPKYLNSPETSLFSKGKELYGLHELLSKNSKPARILIVEGYMDVIALAQFGLNNVVAALGTAISRSQVESLFRFSSELVFCFDGDAAGRQAALRAVDAVLPNLRDGRQVKIMLLPQGQDPDSLVRVEGLSAFDQRVEAAQMFSDYFFDQLGHEVDLRVTEGRAKLAALAKPQLEKIPAGVFKEMMVERLQSLVGLPTVIAPVRQMRSHVIPAKYGQQKGGKISAVRTLAALLVQHPSLLEDLDLASLNMKLFADAGLDFLIDLFAVIEREKPENAAVLLEYYRDSQHAKSVAALANMALSVPEGGEHQEFVGALKRLVDQLSENRLNCLLDKERKTGLNDVEKNELRELLQSKARS